MFASIRNLWREARGKQLRKEFEDAIVRSRALGEEVNSRCLVSILKLHSRIHDEFGPLTNISADGRLQIASALVQIAKRSFKFDMGEGYGHFLMSAYFESSALPGADAKYVFSTMSELLESIDGSMRDSYREYHAQSEDGDEALKRGIARQAIHAAKTLGAATPREAAEITIGRALSDEEWARIKGDWEANW